MVHTRSQYNSQRLSLVNIGDPKYLSLTLWFTLRNHNSLPLMFHTRNQNNSLRLSCSILENQNNSPWLYIVQPMLGPAILSPPIHRVSDHCRVLDTKREAKETPGGGCESMLSGAATPGIYKKPLVQYGGDLLESWWMLPGREDWEQSIFQQQVIWLWWLEDGEVMQHCGLQQLSCAVGLPALEYGVGWKSAWGNRG